MNTEWSQLSLPDNAEWTDIWVSGGSRAYRFWRRAHINQDAIQYGMNNSFWILSATEIEEAGSELAALDKHIEKWGGKHIPRPIATVNLDDATYVSEVVSVWDGRSWIAPEKSVNKPLKRIDKIAKY